MELVCTSVREEGHIGKQQMDTAGAGQDTANAGEGCSENGGKDAANSGRRTQRERGSGGSVKKVV